jgi:hypothetical protein
VLSSSRTVREISRSSIVAQQKSLTAFPNQLLEKSGAESLTHSDVWRPLMGFRLGSTFSLSRVCLRCKSRIAARIAFAANQASAELRARPAGSIWLGLCAWKRDGTCSPRVAACALGAAIRPSACGLLDQIRRPWPQPDPPIGRRNVRPVCSPGCGATNSR